SAITTTARWQLNVLPPSKDERETFSMTDDDARGWVKVDGVKMNYGENVRHFWLRRIAHGVLKHAEPAVVESGAASYEKPGADPFSAGFTPSAGGQLPRGYRSR